LTLEIFQIAGALQVHRSDTTTEVPFKGLIVNSVAETTTSLINEEGGPYNKNM